MKDHISLHMYHPEISLEKEHWNTHKRYEQVSIVYINPFPGVNEMLNFDGCVVDKLNFLKIAGAQSPW